MWERVCFLVTVSFSKAKEEKKQERERKQKKIQWYLYEPIPQCIWLVFIFNIAKNEKKIL